MSQNHPEKPWRILTDAALISKLMGANEHTKIYAIPKPRTFHIPYPPPLSHEAQSDEDPILSFSPMVEVQPEMHIVSEVDKLTFWAAWANPLNAIVVVVDADEW